MVVTEMKAVHSGLPAPRAFPQSWQKLKDLRREERPLCTLRPFQNRLLRSLAGDSEMQRFGFSSDSPLLTALTCPLGKENQLSRFNSDLRASLAPEPQ